MKRLGATTSGVLANLAAQAFPFLLLVIVTPILLRTLGRETYGALILFNLVPLIATKLDLGIVTAGTRAYAQLWAYGDREGARRVVRETLVILCAWGGLLAIVFFASREAIADGLNLLEITRKHRAVFIVAAFSIPLALINAAALIPLRALERYGHAARIQIFGGTVYWVLCVWIAAYGATLTQLVLLGAIVVALTTVALFATAPPDADADGRPSGAGMTGAGDPSIAESIAASTATSTASSTASSTATSTATSTASSTASPISVTTALGPAVAIDTPAAIGSGLRLRPFFGVGAGAFVAQASTLGTYHADKLIISAMISPAAAGAYAICASIASKTLGIIIAGAAYTFPRVTQFDAIGDARGVTQTFVMATRFALMIAVSLAVPLIAFAPAFLRVWIGADFAQSYALALQLLVAGYAINASSVVASNVAIGIGEVRMPAIFGALGSVLTVVAVILLAPRYGATGAALAAIVGMSPALVFNDLIARRLGSSARAASWPLMLRLLIVALPAGLAAAALSSLVEGWLTLIALGGVASLLFPCIWLASFGRGQERMALFGLVRQMRERA